MVCPLSVHRLGNALQRRRPGAGLHQALSTQGCQRWSGKEAWSGVSAAFCSNIQHSARHLMGHRWSNDCHWLHTGATDNICRSCSTPGHISLPILLRVKRRYPRTVESTVFCLLCVRDNGDSYRATPVSEPPKTFITE